MKKDILPRNNKGQLHGIWSDYLSNGTLFRKGHYINGIRYGYWIGNWSYFKPSLTFYLK